MSDLIGWKARPGRKPLLIRGARQVGKTWLMQAFGRLHFKQTAYVNFEKSPHLKTLFIGQIDIGKILAGLQVEVGFTIDPEHTLLIFDEIQAIPEAITSLKYFSEDAPQYHLMCAGSLLGVALHLDISFPVGKVEFLNLYPLTFLEFLSALGEEDLIRLLSTLDWQLIATFKARYIERLRQYYFVGGMPEVVALFAAKQDYSLVRSIHKQILNAYELDFSKHAPASVVPRIRMVWNSIPAQMAKENRKFIYGQIKEGARAKDYEMAMAWLIDCGLIYRVTRVTQPGVPLKAYEDAGAFKLFLVDLGLLAAMGDVHYSTLLDGNALFREFKGALTEQYVLQQLMSEALMVVHYWSAAHGIAEVDFVLQYKNMVVPLEVKAEENLKSKSLRVYQDKFAPEITLRTSMSDYRTQDWLINIPLYALNNGLHAAFSPKPGKTSLHSTE